MPSFLNKKYYINLLDILFIISYTGYKEGVLTMAQTVNVNFKLDADVKRDMERACADMGLSMSAAFTIFAKKSGTGAAHSL